MYEFEISMNIKEYVRGRVPGSGVEIKRQNLISCYTRDFVSEKSQFLWFNILVWGKGNSVLT